MSSIAVPKVDLIISHQAIVPRPRGISECGYHHSLKHAPPNCTTRPPLLLVGVNTSPAQRHLTFLRIHCFLREPVLLEPLFDTMHTFWNRALEEVLPSSTVECSILMGELRNGNYFLARNFLTHQGTRGYLTAGR